MTETLTLSHTEYDYHSLKKIAETHGILGNISIVDAPDKYIVIIKDCREGAALAFQRHLDNLTRNIWSH